MISAAPAMSGRPRLDARLSETSLGVATITTAAIGRLMKKIQRQEARSVSTRREHDAEGGADPGQAAPDGHGPGPFMRVGEQQGQEGESGRADEGGSDALNEAAGDEHAGLLSEAALADESAKIARPIRNMRLRPSRSPMRPPSISSAP